MNDNIIGLVNNSIGEEREETNQSIKNDNKRQKFRHRKDTENSDSNSSIQDTSTSTATTNTLNINSGPPNVWSGLMGMGYGMVGVNMLMDPGIMQMNNYGIIPPILGPDPGIVPAESALMMSPVKEIIHCKSCTLFPPNPNAPLPSLRERPPGCRTVFVGGLPENMTEEIIMEIFERCGEITTLRLSKKNFCHLRFMFESSVDAAIFLSGYRVRIGSNSEVANTGRLHVDYAQARDDQYEWECRQRQLQREQRHRERMEEERLRPPSPPPVVHYTDHEATSVAEKIKQDETFTKAVQIVITWLERGDCNKRNSNNFYSMIQSTNSHVRRLLNEKTQYEEELRKAKEIMRARMQGILLQFGQIERLFGAACHKKVWDHFTKAQRKNIETWKKQSLEIKNIQLEDSAPAKERDDDEMDVSEDEESSSSKKKQKTDNNTQIDDSNKSLREENNLLICQIEAYKNEVEVLKMETKRQLEQKDKELKILQESNKRHMDDETNFRKITRFEIDGSDTEQQKNDINPNLTNEEARLVGVLSTFLNVHPFGAGLDYIWSYVSKLNDSLRPSEIEAVMSKYPTVFKQELVGIGANIERKWLFIGFHSNS